MEPPLRLHPQWKLVPIDDSEHQWVVLNYQGLAYPIEGQFVQPLLEGIRNSKGLAKISAENPSLGFQLLQVGFQLKTLGVLENADQPHAEYFTWTEDSLPAGESTSSVHYKGIPTDQIERLQEISVGVGHEAIFTSDLLHPSLAKPASEKALLFIMPFGPSPTVGPVIDPATGPCITCLQHQLLENQPLRKWLRTKSGLSYLNLPIPAALPVTPLHFQNAIVQVAQAPNTLLTFDANTKSWVSHHIRKRPQCPACGNPGFMEAQIKSPIHLADAKVNFEHDGGSRTVSPETTVHTLMPYVSPVSGVITELTSLSEATEIPIYRSAFYKQPKLNPLSQQNSFVVQSLGKGFEDIQSRASALCESIERWAAQYQGDEYTFAAKPSELDQAHYLPQSLVSFSERQFRDFENEKITNLPHSTAPLPTNPALHWTQAWSLTNHSPTLLPLSFCFANHPFADDDYIKWNSNGCAAGNTLEEAILQGLYELIERDAVAIWWYNEIPRPHFPLSALSLATQKKFANSLQEHWEYWLLDITHDFSIPTLVAVGQSKSTGKFCLGFGCHHSSTLAAQRALTELCQLISIRNQPHAAFDFESIPDQPWLHPQGTATATPTADSEGSFTQRIGQIVNAAKNLGLETLVVNYSRPDVPIKTAKVVVPGLCHIWPQLGHPRLYHVPVALGWLPLPKPEEDLNPIPLLL